MADERLKRIQERLEIKANMWRLYRNERGEQVKMTSERRKKDGREKRGKEEGKRIESKEEELREIRKRLLEEKLREESWQLMKDCIEDSEKDDGDDYNEGGWMEQGKRRLEQNVTELLEGTPRKKKRSNVETENSLGEANDEDNAVDDKSEDNEVEKNEIDDTDEIDDKK